MNKPDPSPGASPPPERQSALDLLRPKSAPASRLVRTSLAEARRAVAPYTATTRVAWSSAAKNPLARLGAIILAVFGLIAIFAELLASDLPLVCRAHGVVYVLPAVTHPAALAALDCERLREHRAPGDWLVPPLVAHGPNTGAGRGGELRPPSRDHPFGTDAIGRDVFARVVYGSRTALGLGGGGALILVGLGLALGAVAGFRGGLVDNLVSRAVEALTAIPTLLLVLVVGALVPRATTATLVLTIALTRWTDLARLVRADVIATLGKDYVTAARALGASPGRILRRHVMPHAIGPAIVAAAFGVASIVLIEASVDFLRLGALDETMTSWGETLGEARASMGAWWLIAFPGLALLATLIALQLVGEAAREALDPFGER